MKTTPTISLAVLGCTLFTASALSQDTPKLEPKPDSKPAQSDLKPPPMSARQMADRYRDTNLDPVKTFYLKPNSGPNDDNEILTGLRLILDPSTKLYLVPSQHIMVVRSTPENLALAAQVLEQIDRPRHVYKLTYTVVESDAGKRVGVQHFSMAMVSSARTTLKNGSKVPVMTGGGGKNSDAQFVYLDIGLNFDATIDEYPAGLRLRSKVEQSSATEEKTIGGIQEPLIRQTVLEGTSIIVPGKTLNLGSVDVAGSTRHLDIDVLLEPQN